MKRYQVYLNPNSVSILDEYESITKISRSKIIRAIADRLAEEFVLFIPDKRKKSKNYTLANLAGILDDKTTGKTNFAQHVDDIYNDV